MKKNLRLLSLAFSMLVFFCVNAQQYASFDGSGTFKFQNTYDHGHHMVYPATGELMEAQPDGTSGFTSEFKIVPNAANTGWYNIMSTDDLKFVISGMRTDGVTEDQYNTRIKAVADGGMNNPEALFRFKADEDITNATTTIPAVVDAWNIQRKVQLSTEPESMYVNVKSGDVNNTKAFDLGKGLPNGQQKYIWKIIKNGSEFTWQDGGIIANDIEDAKIATNLVYPNPSATGIFKLKENTDWAVYSVSGTAVAEGKGQVVDISSSPKGVYIIKYDGITQKIMIQ